MIKRTIDISPEEIATFLSHSPYVISNQIDGDILDDVLDDLNATYDMLLRSNPEDPADEVPIPKPSISGCFYIIAYLNEVVGLALLEDEIGYFFQIYCVVPEYYEHVVKLHNYMIEKNYPVWIENGNEIAKYLKNKYHL